ncbi:hypothetical protein C8R44DRAFT_751509 [Mycena epipterygia]|nr:hypothetical protein C8R44DRAFT_751509 [Mycena epipterygia]
MGRVETLRTSGVVGEERKRKREVECGQGGDGGSERMRSGRDSRGRTEKVEEGGGENAWQGRRQQNAAIRSRGSRRRREEQGIALPQLPRAPISAPSPAHRKTTTGKESKENDSRWEEDEDRGTSGTRRDRGGWGEDGGRETGRSGGRNRQYRMERTGKGPAWGTTADGGIGESTKRRDRGGWSEGGDRKPGKKMWVHGDEGGRKRAGRRPGGVGRIETGGPGWGGEDGWPRGASTGRAGTGRYGGCKRKNNNEETARKNERRNEVRGKNENENERGAKESKWRTTSESTEGGREQKKREPKENHKTLLTRLNPSASRESARSVCAARTRCRRAACTVAMLDEKKRNWLARR